VVILLPTTMLADMAYQGLNPFQGFDPLVCRINQRDDSPDKRGDSVSGISNKQILSVFRVNHVV